MIAIRKKAAAVAAPAPPAVRQLSQEEVRAARIKKFGHLEKSRAIKTANSP
jgi:hypothetical protein